jgi:hypothetical protein
MEKASCKVNIFNSVSILLRSERLHGWIGQASALCPRLNTRRDRGLIGDNLFIFLDTKKIRSGWVGSRSSIARVL